MKLKKISGRVLKSFLIGVIVYLGVSFLLIFWPITGKRTIKNYDYRSIKENAGNFPLGEKLWIKARDGHELFSRLYRSESKNVMILIHGSGSESRYLAKLADSLARGNIATVITPDLRGHGENQGKRGDIDFIGQLETDIGDMIIYSRQILRARQIILAGHSSGGGLVLRFIGNPKNPDVDKAIMLAPYLGYNAPTVKPNSGGWVTVETKRIIGLSMLNRIGIQACNGLPVLFFNRPDEINDELQVPFYSFRMTVNFTPADYREEIRQIHIPCLVLVGRQDESFYPEQFITAFAPAKNFVRTEILENTKHLSLVSNPETFRLIREWMKSEN